jgi:hypothetical protein
MSDERRRQEDTRLALLEQSHEAITASLKRIETKLDTYNQYRERLDNACAAFKEHKEGHWKGAALAISLAGIVSGALSLLTRR